MNRRDGLMRMLLPLAMAALACNLTGGGRGQPPSVPTAPQGSDPQLAGTPGPTAIPPGAWLELDPPPPAGIIDALQAKVNAGEWTYEQGLVASLRLLVGEASVEETFAEAPTSLEGTGVLLDAQRYLAIDPDAATRAEIERLLRILAPPAENLLLYSAPEGSSFRRGGGLARPALAEEDCAKLYAAGFPPGSTAKCFLYKEATVGTTKIQVFYPITLLPQGFTIGHADAALQAAIDSVKAYTTLSVPGQATVMKNVQVVFTLLESKGGTSYAVVPTDPGQEPCQVILFPLLISDNESEKANVTPTPGGPPPGYAMLQQTVAHEMFHCFQVWNFPKLSANATWGVQDWWGEATATYFSNVVYPTVNAEWRWNDAWAFNSGDTSLAHMSYENWGFFQYLANRIGNNGVLSLIHSLNAAAGKDEAAQEGQLATYPDIQQLFDDYARAYMDGKIADASKALIPTTPAYVFPKYRLEVLKDELFHLGAPPFTLMRYGLTFGSGKEYLVSPVTAGAAGFDASRPHAAVGLWADLPPKVQASCSFARYYVLMTSTAAPASQIFSIDLTVQAGDPIGCDECLIGIWDVNVESFAEYAEAPFVDTPGFYEFKTAGGLWRYRFRADGTMTGEFDFFYSYRLNQENAPFGNDITVDGDMTFLGTGNGTYLSDGLSNLGIFLPKDSVVIDQVLYMNGDKVDDSSLNEKFGPDYTQTANAIYSCDADAGELLINFVPDLSLPPILFDRASGTP